MDTISDEEIIVSEEGGVRQVSMEEAVSFLSYRNRASGMVSVGVMMCILSPVLLIALAALQEAGVISLSETAAAGIGLIVLISLIGGAVVLFLTAGLTGQRFEYLEKEEIDTGYGVDGMIKEHREKYRHTWTMQLAAGIMLCVVSVIPIGFSLLIFGKMNWQ